jgi:hypothetical protein
MTITCHDVKSRLAHSDPAADDTLSPEILAHIEGCPDCERLQDRLAAILDPKSALPREIQPARDLWPAIASRLEETNERAPRNLWAVLPLAAAAAIAGVIITSLFSLPLGQDPSLATDPIRTAQSRRLPVTQVEAGFLQTRGALVKMVEARKSLMSPEQLAVLEQTLTSIDSAATDLHVALERDPYNSSLLFQLSYTRQKELHYLQQVIL